MSHDLPLGVRQVTGEVPSTHSKDDIGPIHRQDISVLRAEVAELSYRCEALSAEKAELEREKARLLEKVGLLASERDHLKSALVAASKKSLTISEKAEGLTCRPWWKRMFR